MRRIKPFAVILACLLCVFLVAAALAEGALSNLWDSGCDFLFRTSNVTVTGEASFSLDGKHFKTAQLHYIQDGYNSFYGLKLVSPRKDGSEKESGWTIIANTDENDPTYGSYYVMEAFYPGTYLEGYGPLNDTVLRRSVQLDALTELGGLVIAQIEPLLPEGTLTVDGSQVRLQITQDQIPPVALGALNVGVEYLCDRWFGYSHDLTINEEYLCPFDDFITPTQALAYGTQRWTLRSADVTFTTDEANRLTSAAGTVRVASTFYDGVDREVEVTFSVAMDHYGTSTVPAFDADAYGVAPRPEWGWEAYEEYQGDENVEPASGSDYGEVGDV